MSVYRRILLAIDLSADSTLIGQRARTLATACDAQLHLIHVVEPIPPLSFPTELAGPSMVATQVELINAAQRHIDRLTQQLGMPKSNGKVVVGSTKREVIREAAEIGADLIVIGSRERHGLALLLKHTEDAVVHRAPCDVLAVRLSERDQAR